MSVSIQDRPAPTGTQAIVRALRLMKAINRSVDPRTLDDLATSHGLTKSTAHRILSALVSEGMARQDASTRTFSPGPESFSTGIQSVAQFDIRSVARPILEKLSAVSGETVTLEIRIENEMLILDEINGKNLVGARAEIGTRWPMYATSSGKAILATMLENELDQYLIIPRERLTENTLVNEIRLRTDLAEGVERRFWTSMEELQQAFCAVSTTICDQNGVVSGTVSIGGPAHRLNQSRLCELGGFLVEEVGRL